jgi:nucleoid-associated protein YgaU
MAKAKKLNATNAKKLAALDKKIAAAKKAAEDAKSKAAKAEAEAKKKVSEAKKAPKKVTATKKAPAAKKISVKKSAAVHKFIKGVNPKKSLTLYNGFLGFKEPNATASDVHNVLKDYWNGYDGKKGCQGEDCHNLRIDSTRSCDQESICRITKFE